MSKVSKEPLPKNFNKGRESDNSIPGQINCIELHVCWIMKHISIQRQTWVLGSRNFLRGNLKSKKINNLIMHMWMMWLRQSKKKKKKTWRKLNLQEATCHYYREKKKYEAQILNTTWIRGNSWKFKIPIQCKYIIISKCWSQYTKQTEKLLMAITKNQSHMFPHPYQNA